LNLDEWRYIFIITGFFAVSIVAMPVISTYFPQTHEPFFAMAVLGKRLQAGDYYPTDELILNIREPVPWNIYLYNQMGESQYTSIKFKILNNSVASPNTSLCIPSPAPVIYEFRNILLSNETKIVPFTWEIIGTYNDADTTIISKIKINESPIDVDIVIENDKSFRLVLELWLYDNISTEFSFAWISNGEPRCIWNQLWITFDFS